MSQNLSLKRKRKKISSNDDVNAYWTLGEKEAFLKALKKYGLSKNDNSLEKIAKDIGTKDAVQVEYYLKRRGMKDINTDRDSAPINLWLDKYKRLNSSKKHDFLSALDQAFGECAQEEFREIYQFLGLLLKNEYPPNLSAVSADILLELMTDLAGLIQDVGMKDINEIVRKVEEAHKCPSPKQDKTKKDSDEDRVAFYKTGFVDGGSDLFTLNPLDFSPKLLRDVYAKVRSSWEEVMDS